MASNNVRVGGARVDFSAEDAQYQAVVRRVQNQNERLARSYAQIGRGAQRQSRFVGQLTGSLQSSVVSLTAYAVGLESINRLVGGSVRAFMDFERGLIAVQKTTDLTETSTQQLGRNFTEILTRASALGEGLPVSRDRLLEIAEVAGQLNVRGVSNLTRFTETVALLGVTTDLSGNEAANALGRIVANTRASIDDVERLGAAVTLLGNRFVGGERDIISLSNEIGRATAQFRLNAQTALALSATLAESGVRFEAAGTVIQRTIRGLTVAAIEAREGTSDTLSQIAQRAGITGQEFGNILRGRDYAGALQVLADALRNASEEGGTAFDDLISSITGGGNDVRVTSVLSVLAQQSDRFRTALELTNMEWMEQTALIREAGLFAESSSARLQVVQNQLQSQATGFGQVITPAIVAVAENFRLIELAIVGAGTALAARFGTRAIGRVRDYSASIAQAREETEQLARQEAAQARLQRARASQVVRALDTTDISDRAVRARNRLEVAERRATRATLGFRAAQAELSRTLTRTSRIARIASGTLAALGGPVGAILTAVSLGATAWALWGRNASDASQTALERLREVEESARSATSSLERQSRALLAQSEIRRRALTEEIARAQDQLQALRRNEGQVGSNQFRGVSQQEAVDAAERRVAALQMERRELSDQIRATTNALSELRDRNNTIGESTQAVTESVNALGDAIGRERESIESLLSLRPVEIPDVEGQAQRARDIVRSIRDQISAEERRQQQLSETVDLRGQELIAAQRAQEALNDFADQQRDATRDQLDAIIRLGAANSDLAEAERRLRASDTDANREALEAAQQRVAATRRAAQEAQVFVELLAGQGPEYERLAMQLRTVLEGATDGIQEQGRAFQVATELAQSGVNSLENALVELATSGRASFRNFANAILSDLSRILIRATVTANILRALGINASGDIQGGLLGRLQGLFGGGTEQAHSGGVVGQISARHRGLFRPNERIVVVEKGEEVLTRNDPRHAYNFGRFLRNLPRYHDGGVVDGNGGNRSSGGAMPDVQVVIENRSSVPVEATSANTRVDGERIITNVILNDVRRNGPIAQAISRRRRA